MCARGAEEAGLVALVGRAIGKVSARVELIEQKRRKFCENL